MTAISATTGRSYTSSQLRALFKRADKDKNRQLDFREFIHMQLKGVRTKKHVSSSLSSAGHVSSKTVRPALVGVAGSKV